MYSLTDTDVCMPFTSTLQRQENQIYMCAYDYVSTPLPIQRNKEKKLYATTYTNEKSTIIYYFCYIIKNSLVQDKINAEKN